MGDLSRCRGRCECSFVSPSSECKFKSIALKYAVIMKSFLCGKAGLHFLSPLHSNFVV